MISITNALKLLADDTRLRILRLVAREPLNVSEITSVLGLAQSGISRHLSLLRNAGLLEERREGVWTYYQLSRALRFDTADVPPEATSDNGGDGGQLDEELREVRQFVASRVSLADDPYHDLPRLAEVLRQRENYGGGLNEKLLEPGQSWIAWSRALHFLLPPVEVIDLGCGDGAITSEISRFASRVVGIDSNPRALVAARKRAEREHLEGIEFQEGRIESLPYEEESFDLAIFSQSLHHVAEADACIKEAVRVLRPGGRLIVVDLAPHNEAWVVPKLGHVHLGFAPATLESYFGAAGLTSVQLEQVHQRRGEVFRVVIASGIKPSG